MPSYREFYRAIAEARRAYESGVADLHALVKVRIEENERSGDEITDTTTSVKETTVGRALLWDIVPAGLPFDLVNQAMSKKAISRLVNACYRRLGLKDTVVFADQLMYLGFRQAARAGVSSMSSPGSIRRGTCWTCTARCFPMRVLLAERRWRLQSCHS